MRYLPKVTIMIPTYNQEEYITDAIESALSQDYPNLEVVVTDDCSTDRTKEIAKKYLNDSRFRYIRNDRNLGRVGNYHNTAHNIASGEWLINLDGDDYFVSNTFISEAINSIIKNEDKNIVAYCYNHDINRVKKIINSEPINHNSILISGKYYFLNYYRIGGFGHANILYRRDIGLKIGMYLLPYQACDFHSIIRIFMFGDLILDDRKVSYWRVHGKNCTVLEVEDKQSQAMKTFDAIQDFAKSYFNDEILSKWRFKMNEVSKSDYILTYVSTRRSLKAIKLLLNNFKFRYIYFRLLLKQLIGI